MLEKCQKTLSAINKIIKMLPYSKLIHVVHHNHFFNVAWTHQGEYPTNGIHFKFIFYFDNLWLWKMVYILPGSLNIPAYTKFSFLFKNTNKDSRHP